VTIGSTRVERYHVTSVKPAPPRTAVTPPLLASTSAVVPENPIRAQNFDAALGQEAAQQNTARWNDLSAAVPAES
jgi:hypothetical protein